MSKYFSSSRPNSSIGLRRYVIFLLGMDSLASQDIAWKASWRTKTLVLSISSTCLWKWETRFNSSFFTVVWCFAQLLYSVTAFNLSIVDGSLENVLLVLGRFANKSLSLSWITTRAENDVSFWSIQLFFWNSIAACASTFMEVMHRSICAGEKKSLMILLVSFFDSCGALEVGIVVFSLARAGLLETGPPRSWDPSSWVVDTVAYDGWCDGLSFLLG